LHLHTYIHILLLYLPSYPLSPSLLPSHRYYNSNWFIASIFLHSTLIPFLWWFQPV
jgi:hypothetical protein